MEGKASTVKVPRGSGKAGFVVYSAAPADPEPVYREDNSRYIVSVGVRRCDFTMREVLRDLRSAPNAKR